MKQTMQAAVVVVLSAMIALTGCSDTTPPDSLTSQTVRTLAEKEMPRGLEITDFKRDNGWADPNSPNQYMVKYTYNYRLPKPFGEVILENAQAFEKMVAESEKKGFAGGMETLAWSMQANMWRMQNPEAASKEADNLLKTCAACDDYMDSKHGADLSKMRRTAMVIALYQLAEAGFSTAAKAGDKAPRLYQWTFMKTEKGWQAMQ